ncbi:MAG: hypoxanthine phosphoribosyltransferase [Saprospiraceae bacterium]|nr:hypoxanthine phosphoribosyltransferase [Saprospiraceae bacterium]MCZ2337622.1 hypoxanthine phosphoribosyltransferase [Chitinophagales bacterium]
MVTNKDLIQVGDLTFIKYIDAQDIGDKTAEIGDSIREDFHDKFPMLLVILNGAFMYAADLIRELNFPCEIYFIDIKSYEGTESTGTVKINMPSDIHIKGRHIIIVEDIIDTGNTIAALLPELQNMEPASIHLSAILVKPEAHKHDLKIDYPGFIIPKKFVVGYGLDYNGMGRNLKDIYQLYEP